MAEKRTPTPSAGTGTLASTSEQQNLLGTQQIKGKFTSQDDLLFDATQRSHQQDEELDNQSFQKQWMTFRKFLYDKKSKRILGRTAADWGMLWLFYFIFFSAIAAFFAIFLAIFYIQVSVIQPRLFDRSGIMTDHSNSLPSPGYQTINARDDIRRKECNQNNLPDRDVACMFQPEMKLGTCGKIDSQAALGYDDGSPCVILKLNKMFGWVPDPIVCRSESGDDNTTTTCDGLTPGEMQWFREVGRPGVPLPLLFNGQSIPVTCEGRNSPDVENLLSIRWEPAPSYGSFPAYFFPYYNQRGYLAPLVGAQFNVSRAVLVMVRCRAWAKNIRNADVASRDGAVHFELMVD